MVGLYFKYNEFVSINFKPHALELSDDRGRC
jgi:hypothetical protein